MALFYTRSIEISMMGQRKPLKEIRVHARIALNPSLCGLRAVCMSRGGTHKNAHLNNSRIKPFWKHSQHTRTGTRVVTCREF
jgi:hypothetical protein